MGTSYERAQMNQQRGPPSYGESIPSLGSKRVGGNRNNWIKSGLKTAWHRVRKIIPEGRTENGHLRKFRRRSDKVIKGLENVAILYLFKEGNTTTNKQNQVFREGHDLDPRD